MLIEVLEQRGKKIIQFRFQTRVQSLWTKTIIVESIMLIILKEQTQVEADFRRERKQELESFSFLPVMAGISTGVSSVIPGSAKIQYTLFTSTS